MAFAAFIPITFFHLSLALAEKKYTSLLYLGYGVAIVSLIVSPFGGLVSGVRPKLGLTYWPDAGPFLFLVVVSFLLYVVLSAYVLLRGAYEHVGTRASQMRFVLGSAAIGFIGGGTNFPLWYDIPIPPYGNLIVFVYLLMVGYGIYNRRISGITVDIFKAFIFLLLTGSCALFYVLARVIYGLTFDQRLAPSEYWFNGLIAFAVGMGIFWGVPRFKAWAERMLDAMFRKEKLTSVARLKGLPIEISVLTDEHEIFEKTSQALIEILKLNGVAIYRRGDFGSVFGAAMASGEFPKPPSEIDIELSDPVIHFLTNSPECIVIEQFYGDISVDLERSLVKLREKLGASVVIPIFSVSKLYGFIILSTSGSSNTSGWSNEDVSLLFAVGAQIGLNLQARELERKSNEVDKLVALGTMAAGLSHEIRNPLVSVKTFASLLASNRSMSKVDDEFKKVLVRDVKRISNIVEGVAMFSENRMGGLKSVSLMSIIKDSLAIYKAPLLAGKVEVIMKCDRNYEVRANYDQMIQVFNNLIENSIHAVSEIEHPMIEIKVREVTTQSSESWVEIRFGDNGHGIPEDIRDRVFDPFITSKDTGTRLEKKGMGLGLAITKRIVENHSGGLAISKSRLGGAEFIVSLRCPDKL
jgi:two-component system nitrogen regulation sensor histidine kinase GlnL